MTQSFDFQKIIGLIATGQNVLAADEVDRLVDRLKQLSTELRAKAEGGMFVTGMGDRVKMNVFGPKGNVIQSVDTGENA